jgi:magnesium-protoporphyrin O-methyltransferase
MIASNYEQRRSEIETYFDRTAAEAWSRLTTDAPVGRIRQTVREGRDRMRATLLDWLPQDLTGRRLLDAGCGTGALAFEAALRGAEVVAMDLSPTLIDLARQRLPAAVGEGRIEFLVGDMSSTGIGQFDHIVAMDSLIHYQFDDTIRVIADMAGKARHSILFTFAPRTPLLGCMHAVGRVFPKSNRSPSIEPVAEQKLRDRLAAEPALAMWQSNRSTRISRGFYTSQAFELVSQ